MRLTLTSYKLELAHTFSISRESHDFQDSLIVTLSHEGKSGYGEATANGYYQITSASMAKEIGLCKNQIEAHDFKTPELFFELLNSLSLSNFSKCALDLAAWDLFGKINNTPLYKIWNTNLSNLATTNYTIGIDSVEKMVAKMVEKPWPIYKVKLGTSQDIDIIKALRAKTNAV